MCVRLIRLIYCDMPAILTWICAHKLLALAPLCVRGPASHQMFNPKYKLPLTLPLQLLLLLLLLSLSRALLPFDPFRSDPIASDPFRSGSGADEDDNSELMCQVRVVQRMKQFIALAASRCFASCFPLSLSTILALSLSFSTFLPPRCCGWH